MICKKADTNSAKIAYNCLSSGGIAILPTDTVYGFSGIVSVKSSFDTATYKTDKKIMQIKGRQETKPLIQLIANPNDLMLYTDAFIPNELLKLWPGALTIIVPIKKDSPLTDFVPTVAFRCPGDAWLRSVISLCEAPIYSTSVNISGKPVLETQMSIIEEFLGKVDLIVSDGDKKNALPSTLVSVENGNVKVLRQGSVKV